jgi:TolB protein
VLTTPKKFLNLFVGLILAAGLAGCGRTGATTGPAAFKGKGGLAMVRNGNLFVLNGQDAGLHQLSTTGGVFNPKFSVDGRWISFTNQAGVGNTGSPQLWLVRANGSGLHEVSGLPGPVWSNEYAWSRQTDRLAVAPHAQNGGIWLVPAEGRPTALKGINTAVSNLSWSPGGHRLAYVAPASGLPNTEQGERSDGLYITTLNGDSATRTAQRYVIAGGGIILAGWWPDGGGILFWPDPLHSASVAADGLGLESLDLATGRLLALGVTLVHKNWLTWSPTNILYFISGAQREVWSNKEMVMADVTLEKTQNLLLPSGSVYLSPALSADGKHLAVVFGPVVGPKEHYPNMHTYAGQLSLGVANADGTGFHALSGAGKGISSPVFTKDGKHIIFVRDNALWMISASGAHPTRLAGLGPGFSNFYGYVDSEKYFAYHG